MTPRASMPLYASSKKESRRQAMKLPCAQEKSDQNDKQEP
jgi:hypothetical protein